MNTQPVWLSFVLPAFNEEENAPILAEQLLKVGSSLGKRFEIIFINDGSTDSTGKLLDQLAQDHPEIRAVHFSRNFGHMAALTAGLQLATARGAVITLDCDGQHPTELIPEMVRLWEKGADIVQAVRSRTSSESLFKRLSSWMFYRIINLLGQIDIPDGAADFRLLDRRAVDALNSLPEGSRFVRGLVQWIGFEQKSLSYAAPARIHGKTKYSLFRMMQFAVTGITSFSIIPLRISALMGICLLGLALLYGLYVVICLFTGKPLVLGWTSLTLLTMTFSGVLLLMIGIVSEYIGQLFIEIKRRPIFIIVNKRPESKDNV